MRPKNVVLNDRPRIESAFIKGKLDGQNGKPYNNPFRVLTQQWREYRRGHSEGWETYLLSLAGGER